MLSARPQEATGVRERAGTSLRRLALGFGCIFAAGGLQSATSEDYVGAARCGACHEPQFVAWQGSHHDLAMQVAKDVTVLGDFNDATFTHAGATSAFFRKEEGFYVRTEGPSGEPETFRIAYTFGADPLQQYLIEFPDGRYQALTLAWDTRPEADGGQRWFHLQAEETPAPGNPIHWTGRAYTWNSQCAACHSTGLDKAYEAASGRYSTRWAEINVACEACHGPGKAHVTWAEAQDPTVADMGLAVALFAGEGAWVRADGERTASWQGPPRPGIELNVCAPCHARRRALSRDAEPGMPFLDHYEPALLQAGLYHPDGQIDDEVFVWGSFVQSKMHAAGVTCSDCHAPHGLELKAEANVVCLQCHAPEAFDAPAHHFHEAGAPGSLCINCHMPAKTYMTVDPRRDHSFRVPRPDLSQDLGTPNACRACHNDKQDLWMAKAIDAKFGTSWRRRPTFARALQAARLGEARADAKLLTVVRDPTFPDIARATALTHLGETPGRRVTDALRAALVDASPLVRFAALRAMSDWPSPPRADLAAPLLSDSNRLVRLEAVRVLADVAPEALVPADAEILESGFAALIESDQATADWPETQLNLGNFHGARGDLDAAEAALRKALELDPGFLPAKVNLADLLRSRGRDAEAVALLREVVEAAPDAAEARLALGLALVRQGKPKHALQQLQRASELRPEEPRYSYFFGVGLNSLGDQMGALAVLEEALGRHPRDRDLLYALATIERNRGRFDAALAYAQRLREVVPQDPQAAHLVTQLQELLRRK